VPVAVCLDRGRDLLAALLGVLKSGAAYLPLDPHYPAARLAAMLADARPPAVVADVVGSARLPEHHLPVLPVRASRRGQQPALAAPRSDQLAYVIYTSGSTGRPKGVQITHGAAGWFLAAMSRHIAPDPGDAYLTLASPSFDMSVMDFFLPLAGGARLVLAERAWAVDGAALRRAAVELGVTHMQATPLSWRLWDGSEAKDLCKISGGELLPADLAQRLRAAGPTLWNLYGPTEATVYASIWSVAGDSNGHVPIGEPLDGVSLYVLDPRGRLAPLGVPGHLHIGGPGLARGYRGRPALTAAVFVPDPFRRACRAEAQNQVNKCISVDPKTKTLQSEHDAGEGGRLYKTGDLARHRGDGALVYLGRIDQQVKLNGIRIEPGEIEAHLRDLDGIDDAVVLVQTAASGGRDRLLAYLASNDPTAPEDDAHLRHALAQHLPRYMVPSLFVHLPRLPRTPSGKVDRRALARLETPSPASAAEPAAPPRNATERELVAIWSRLLGAHEVGIHHNFFDLGGDSVYCIQVVAAAQNAGLALSPTLLFRHQTIAELAAVLARRQPKTDPE
jgi:amino acid adenylation domain-containing protein